MLVDLPRAVSLSHGARGWHIRVMDEAGTFPVAEKDDCPTVLDAWAFANRYLVWVDRLAREAA